MILIKNYRNSTFHSKQVTKSLCWAIDIHQSLASLQYGSLVVSSVNLFLGTHPEMESSRWFLTLHMRFLRFPGAWCRGSRECQSGDAEVIEESSLWGYVYNLDFHFIWQNSYQVACNVKVGWTMTINMVPKKIKQLMVNNEWSFL